MRIARRIQDLAQSEIRRMTRECERLGGLIRLDQRGNQKVPVITARLIELQRLPDCGDRWTGLVEFSLRESRDRVILCR